MYCAEGGTGFDGPGGGDHGPPKKFCSREVDANGKHVQGAAAKAMVGARTPDHIIVMQVVLDMPNRRVYVCIKTSAYWVRLTAPATWQHWEARQSRKRRYTAESRQ